MGASCPPISRISDAALNSLRPEFRDASGRYANTGFVDYPTSVRATIDRPSARPTRFPPFDQSSADSAFDVIVGLKYPKCDGHSFASSIPQAAFDPAKVLNDRLPPSAAELSIGGGVSAIGVSMRTDANPEARNPRW